MRRRALFALLPGRSRALVRAPRALVAAPRALVPALLLAALAPAPAAAQVVVADRAGPVREGVPAHPEDGVEGVRAAGLLGVGVALQAAVSADGVAFAFPDADLDRLTGCTGPLDRRTAVELDAACPVRWLGTPAGPLASAPASPTAPVSTLRLALAEAADAEATPIVLTVAPRDLERLPAILEAVPAMLPGLILRSASPAVLAAAAAQRPGIELALLTTDPGARGRHAWISPPTPVDDAWVAAARAAGRRVLAPTEDAASATADALLALDPAAALLALGRPIALAATSPAPLAVELLFPSLASDGATDPRVELRWRTSEPAPVQVDVRPREMTGEADWRLLVPDTARRSAFFTGAPGTSYAVRARTRGGATAEGLLVVPLDEADPAVRRRGGWRRVRRAGAWGDRVALTRRRGGSLRTSFEGTALRVIAPLDPEGASLRVTLDGEATTVSLRGPAAPRQVVFASGRLEEGRHHVTLTALGGGPVAIDAIAVE